MINFFRTFFLFTVLLTSFQIDKVRAQSDAVINKSAPFSFLDDNPLYLVSIGDADLAIRYHKGIGTPVIFVHGSWDDHQSWLSVAEQLVKKIDNPVILYDRRGHSASTPDKTQGTISQDVNDLVQLTKKLGFETAHFIGHSYGANIVVQLASTHPEIAESIILYEPPMFGLLKDNVQYKTDMQLVKEAMTTAKSLLEKGEIEKGTVHFIEKVAFGENSWQTVFDDRARSTMLASYRTWLDQSNDLERLNIHPEKLNLFRGAITLITGSNSIPVYPAVSQELKGKVEKIQIRQISGAGHGGLISHPAETASVIWNHLQETK